VSIIGSLSKYGYSVLLTKVVLSLYSFQENFTDAYIFVVTSAYNFDSTFFSPFCLRPVSKADAEGPSNDGRRHGRGTYLLLLLMNKQKCAEGLTMVDREYRAGKNAAKTPAWPEKPFEAAFSKYGNPKQEREAAGGS
jgi:hypothetical protein